ncbi:HNH endonuclease [Corallococcus sp. CA049B]|uniref:HNH endonuclease n=1 Tax=Corallococcus sp. CA049B TaxID=2316730 RepID=UPI0011C35637|nr:HNH endonuclease [Corallococcus sp. CA049B]
MPINIYTKQPFDDLSNEHIIPNFLGGRLQTREIVNGHTNQHFSRIDAALTESLKFFIVSLNARSHREPGDSPPSMQVSSPDGEKLIIDADGSTRAVPGSLDISFSEEGVHITGTPPNEMAVRKALERKAKQAGVVLDIDKSMDKIRHLLKPQLKPIPPIQFTTELWTTEPYRATAKIAFNLLGFRAPLIALQGEFDAVRKYILNGERPEKHLVEAAAIDIRTPEGKRIGPLDHLVLVRGDASSSQVRAIVVYFGLLAFVVKLGDCRLERGFSYSYRVDQLGGAARLDDAYDLALEVPSFEVLSARSDEQVLEAVHEQSGKLLLDVQEIHNNLWINSTVKRHWKAAFRGKSQGQLSEDEQMQFINELTHEIAVGLSHHFHEASRRRNEAASAELHAAGSDNGED